MTDKKKYLIELLLKCSLLLNPAERYFQYNADFLRACFSSISQDKFDNIIKKYGINEYRESLILLIDSNFTLEEIQELINFFRSSVGRKIINKDFNNKIEELINNLCLERKQELSRSEIE